MARVEITMPQLGESIAEGKVIKWLKQVGESVERDENLLEVMTDKVTVEIPSITRGKLVEVLVQEDQSAQVGEILGFLEGDAVKTKAKTGAPSGKAEPVKEPPPPKATEAPLRTVPKSKADQTEQREIPPGVRTFAHEMGVDLSLVQGTGVGGRIRRKDVLDYITKQKISPQTSKEPEVVLEEGDEMIPLTEMRRLIAEHMALSKQTIPHVMTAHEVDMSHVVAAREKNKSRPSVTSYIALATAKALRKYPGVNSVYTSKGLVQRKGVHIGIAVATEDGLLVPVVKNADKQKLEELHKGIKDLAERARSKKLNPDEVRGGTFTITNPGVFNSLISAPVIPVGQSGILGVGTMVKRPVVVEDKVEIRPILILSLSFDHRTFDGATADSFLEEIRKGLETSLE